MLNLPLPSAAATRGLKAGAPTGPQPPGSPASKSSTRIHSPPEHGEDLAAGGSVRPAGCGTGESARWPGDRLRLQVCVAVFATAPVRVCVRKCVRATMPRSFLVKKVKLDEFSAGPDMENAYRHRADLSLRLHDKGRSSRTRMRH